MVPFMDHGIDDPSAGRLGHAQRMKRRHSESKAAASSPKPVKVVLKSFSMRMQAVLCYPSHELRHDFAFVPNGLASSMDVAIPLSLPPNRGFPCWAKAVPFAPFPSRSLWSAVQQEISGRPCAAHASRYGMHACRQQRVSSVPVLRSTSPAASFLVPVKPVPPMTHE